MRPNAAVAERQGDLGGEKVAMSFDQNSLAHIMSVLTDLYSDPELAVIREYSTNALDAQIRAGVDRPIEVSIPNSLTPFFKVKDYGIGMNAQDIREIYSQYGASTKRDSDEFTGMLGLGCKAALTYTNQFTVTAVKDGIRTQVVVSRTEDGSGMMEILSETETDDSNGVEICVPAKRVHAFALKSSNFFRFWPEGTVLVNGEAPEPPQGRRLTDNMMIIPGMEFDVIVMGNVPYPIESGRDIQTKSWQARYGIITWVNIGDVSFTPSREALHYTLRTEKTLERIREEFKNNVRGVTQREVDAADSKFEALKVFSEWSRTLLGNVRNNSSITYKGETIPTNVSIGKGLNFRLNHSRYAVEESRYETVDGLRDRVVVFNYKNVDLKSHNREKIRLWLSQNNITCSSVLVVDELPEIFGDWIPLDKTYDWEDVKKTKAPKAIAAPRGVPEYEVLTPDDPYFRIKALDEINDNTVKVLVSNKEWKDFDRDFVTIFRRRFPNITIVKISSNRWDKFRRDKKNVKYMHALILEGFNASKDLLTSEDKMYMKIDYNTKYLLPHLDDTKIDDPDLATMIRVSRQLKESDRVIAYREIKGLLNNFPHIGYEPADISDTLNVMERYPMLAGTSRHAYYDHAILYINAVYQAMYKP